jgi:phosphoribosylaminoimidazole (AIR) synthetase
MGVGLVLILDEKMASPMKKVLEHYPSFSLYQIGEVVPGEPSVRIIT